MNKDIHELLTINQCVSYLQNKMLDIVKDYTDENKIKDIDLRKYICFSCYKKRISTERLRDDKKKSMYLIKKEEIDNFFEYLLTPRIVRIPDVATSNFTIKLGRLSDNIKRAFSSTVRAADS